MSSFRTIAGIPSGPLDFVVLNGRRAFRALRVEELNGGHSDGGCGVARSRLLVIKIGSKG